MTKQLFVIISVCCTLLFPAQGYAQETISTTQSAYFITKGSMSPETGYLLTPPVMSQFVAKFKTQQTIFDEKLSLEIKHTQELDTAQCDKLLSDQKVIKDNVIKIQQIELDAQTKKINVLTQHIATLEKKSSPPIWLYITSGAVGGAVVTIATIFIVNNYF